MENIINYVSHELIALKPDDGKHKTSDVRKLASRVYKLIENKSFESKLEICESLLEQKTWAMGVIAYDIAFRERKNYTYHIFDRFERWLINYVRGWGDCDDFCTHAFGALLAEYNDLFDKILAWCDRPEFWMRRAAAVILIYPINKGMSKQLHPFMISDALMCDENDLVLKGYGWMLKVYGSKEPVQLKKYLSENVKRMPRISFRYALEKLDEETRRKLMQK
ncbi:DNA alkylation repair protein [Clostridium sp. Cult2]|uniref:DNA alkylation repair protein n=1 Tax=Clostridium sp. Cult2 TaxID=2079003 RepID=UPI001F15836E